MPTTFNAPANRNRSIKNNSSKDIVLQLNSALPKKYFSTTWHCFFISFCSSFI